MVREEGLQNENRRAEPTKLAGRRDV